MMGILRRVPVVAAVALGSVALATGCLYPGSRTHGTKPANLGDVGMLEVATSEGIRFQLPPRQSARPTARPPIALAVARVQAHGGNHGSGYSTFGPVSPDGWVFYDARQPRAISLSQSQRLRLRTLPLVHDVVEPQPHFERDPMQETLLRGLRRGALLAGADLLLIYTFDSFATTSDGIMPLDIFTIGMLPDVVSSAKTSGHAVLIDARSGFIYAHATAAEDSWQLANQWTGDEARRDAIRRAERRAFDRLIDSFDPMWHRLTHTYWGGAAHVR